jgi:hypothetical protein
MHRYTGTMKFLMSRGGGAWDGVIAVLSLDALAISIADVGLLADAGGGAFGFQAFLGHLRSAVDQEHRQGVALGHAVELATTIFHEHFAITGAFALSLDEQFGFRGNAVGGFHANALFVLQVAFLAEAADDAVLGAHRAGVRVGAGGRASSAARVEDFVFVAFRDWWQHHERGWGRVDFRALFFLNASTIGTSAEMSRLAGAARHADTRADGVGVVAGAIATLALTEFFIFGANLGRHRDGVGGGGAAGFGLHAHALLVLQVAGFAEASDHALARAHGSGMWVGAGGSAGGTARHEELVVLALGHFRRVGEEHGGLWGFALGGRHADAALVSQVSLFAEASNDAVLGANWARGRVGAGGSAGRAASLEFFIVRARWQSGWFLHWDFRVGRGIAILRTHALALGVLQESLVTETAHDALERTNLGRFRVGAIRNACGSALGELGIRAALVGKSRDGNSEPEGANAEQQRESKARVHR